MKIEKVVIITRATRLEENIQRFNTKRQAQFIIENRGQSFEDYELEDSNYRRAHEVLVQSIPRDLNFQVIDRRFLPNYIFGPNDLVVTLGQDGLVVNTAKYLTGQHVLAINPDPERFDGVLLPFLPAQAAGAFRSLLDARFSSRQISMARVDLQDGQKLYAFNDFFIGAANQTSARYTISHGERQERHISSGIIVSTPAGATGWMSSLFNMTRGIQSFGGLDVQLDNPELNWEDRRLLFMVREPFRSKWSGADLVAGGLQENEQLVLESHMPDNGVIFSDGMLNDYMEFNSGATATIGLAEKRTDLITEIL